MPMKYPYHRQIVLVVFGLLIVSLGCNRKATQASAASSDPPPTPVQVKRVESKPVEQFTEYIATLKSRNSAILKPEVEGQITRIMVTSGQAVEAGTPLMEIDPQKQEATVHSQEAAHRSRRATLELNRTELERRKKLFEAGVVSKQELDQAQTAYDSSKADVDALEASLREQQVQLRYFLVKAPATGTIGDIPVRVGDRVTSSTQLTTLDKSGALEAYISIPSEKSIAAKRGTPVEVLDENGGVGLRTAVSFVSPRVDPATQLLLVKAEIPDSDHRFRNDQLVHVRVVYSQEKHPLIPVTAVIRVSGQTFAYTAETSNGKTIAKQRPVRLGEVVGNDYVILDGVNPGESLIVTGTQMLVDGAPIMPQS
jgi:RND family efflux transporter MFP subunit